MHGHFYGNFTGNLAHAQSVCTRPFSWGEGPGDEAIRPHTPCTQALRGRRDGLDTRLFKYMKSLRQNLMIQIMIDSIIQ